MLKSAEGSNRRELTLPPLYGLFVKYFKLGKGGVKKQELKFNEDFVQLTDVIYYGKGGYRNPVSHFLAISELETEFEILNMGVDEYHKQGFVKIGLFDINDSIILGVTEEHEDEIWKLNGDWGQDMPYIEKIASDIFEFMTCCQETVIQMNLTVRGVNENQLYKNWDEDFWRVGPSEGEPG